MRPISIAALAIAAATGATAQPPVVPIDLISFSYAPSPIHLRAGLPVTLAFTNRSRSGHDFTAREFFRSAKILSGTVANGEIELAGGQSGSVTLVPAAGRYSVHCGHSFHRILGMRSRIIVE